MYALGLLLRWLIGLALIGLLLFYIVFPLGGTLLGAAGGAINGVVAGLNRPSPAPATATLAQPTAGPTLAPTEAPAQPTPGQPAAQPTQPAPAQPPAITATPMATTVIPGATLVPVAPPQASGITAATCDDIVRMASGPYPLIGALDRHPGKVSHDQGGFTLTTGANEVAVFWTGRYDVADITDGGKTIPVQVDGKTGVYALRPNQSIVVSSPSGVLKVRCDNLTALSALPTGGQAATNGSASTGTTACAQAKDAVDIINRYKASNPGRIYTDLDQLASRNAEAEFRSLEQTSTIEGRPLMTLVWLRTGNLGPQDSIIELDRHEGKSLYLATKTARLNATHQQRGTQLCTDLNPARDFPWWGR